MIMDSRKLHQCNGPQNCSDPMHTPGFPSSTGSMAISSTGHKNRSGGVSHPSQTPLTTLNRPDVPVIPTARHTFVCNYGSIIFLLYCMIQREYRDGSHSRIVSGGAFVPVWQSPRT